MYTYTYTHVYVCIHMPGEQAREEAEKKVGHGSKHKHRATNTPPSRHPRKKGKWQKTTNGNSQVRVPRKSTGCKMQACVTKAQDSRSKTQNLSTSENNEHAPKQTPGEKGEMAQTTNHNSQARVPGKSRGLKKQACVTNTQDSRSKTQNLSTSENRTFLPPSPPSPPRCFCALYRARSDFRCLASNKKPPHPANRTESCLPSGGGAFHQNRNTESLN